MGDAIVARVEMPEGSPPAGGWPGVVVLHGSSGLFPNEDDGPCEESMYRRFHEWAELLNDRGYAAIFPASFYSRGYCAWYERDKDTDGDKEERLVERAHDAAAAARWFCNDYRVDCSRLALMGFSNGASVTLLLMHEDLRDADDFRLHEVAVPPLVGGVAYYPGCGLQGELANDLDFEDFDRYYFPKAPTWIPHAERDHLLDDCEELRDPQVEMVADVRGIEKDRFDLQAYDGAKHGFDGSDEHSKKQDIIARVKAEKRTLEILDDWLE